MIDESFFFKQEVDFIDSPTLQVSMFSDFEHFLKRAK